MQICLYLNVTFAQTALQSLDTRNAMSVRLPNAFIFEREERISMKLGVWGKRHWGKSHHAIMLDWGCIFLTYKSYASKRPWRPIGV
jgi:hypothetical protein